jgi:hypothetical protein
MSKHIVVTTARGINQAAIIHEDQRTGRSLDLTITVVLTDQAIGGDHTTGVCADWMLNRQTDRIKVIDLRCHK